MRNVTRWTAMGVVGGLLAMPAVWAQRPYIGFVYPAGGQQGTTFQVKLGGQTLDNVNTVLVSGAGVHATLLEYFRPLGPQEITLLSEQLRDLRRDAKKAPDMMAPELIPVKRPTSVSRRVHSIDSFGRTTTLRSRSSAPWFSVKIGGM